jgi:F0F1-type ATP synthase delta subunit
MKTPTHQVAAALTGRVSASDFDEKQFAREVAAYLLDTGRTGQLNSLARDMVKARIADGIVEVTAVSAHDLTDAVRADIRAQIEKLYPNVQRIILNERRDESVIGGVRLEFPEQQLDLSVRNKLNRLKALTT